MKTITSTKIAEGLKVALAATGFISIVMTICYISWFA